MHITELDFQILDFIREQFTSPIMDRFFPIVTSFGNMGIMWIVLALFLIVVKRTRKVGITMIIAIALCGLVGNLILKPWVARVRPYDMNKAIEILIAKPKDFSFPSGHTMVSFASATALFCYHKKIGVGLYFLAGLIAFSRLYLYVHYPSDVLAGMLIGILFGTLSYIVITKGLERRKKNAIED